MDQNNSNKGSIWRIARYFLNYRFLFGLNLMLALGGTAVGISAPQLIRYMVDSVIESHQLNWLLWGTAVLAVIYLTRDLLNMLRIRLNNTIEQKVLIDIRRDLHDKLLKLPVSYFDKRKTGDVASRVTEDVVNVERVLLDGTEQGLTSIFMLTGIGGILFWMQPTLAVAVLVPIPILIGLAIYYFKTNRKNWKQVRESSGLMNSILVEHIQGHRLISSFALEEREKSRFNDQAQDLRTKTLKAMYRWSMYSPGTSFISSLGIVAVLGLGGFLMMDGKLTTGEFISFFFYCGMLQDPVSRLNGLNHMLSAAKASGDRVFEVLDHEVDIENPESPKPFPAAPVGVHYEQVGFAYDTRASIMDGFHLQLEPGKVTALVGHTGAGKTTVANLLLRYYDVEHGKVLLNGTDVRELDLTDLRSSVGVVSQDPFLFDGTIEENLLLARADADETALWEALEGACVADFVKGLPKGIHTLIGERGIRLSMGEKQRLTIARVLLKNPPLIILDEATSSVDTLTERKIQTALEKLMNDRTVLVIAHRLSTIQKADKIVVLDKGKVIETGSHQDLLKHGGAYYQYWNLQNDLVDEHPEMFDGTP